MKNDNTGITAADNVAVTQPGNSGNLPLTQVNGALGSFLVRDVAAPSIPEPGTFVIFALGLFGLLVARRRRCQAGLRRNAVFSKTDLAPINLLILEYISSFRNFIVQFCAYPRSRTTRAEHSQMVLTCIACTFLAIVLLAQTAITTQSALDELNATFTVKGQPVSL